MDNSLRDALIPVCGTIAVIAVIIVILFSRDMNWRRKRSAFDTNPNASLAFKNFYRVYTDSIMGHAIFSIQSYGMVPRYLAEMSPQERANAEALMIRVLPNSLAAYGLGLLGSQKAVPLLRSLQRSTRGPEVMNIELALARIGVPDDGMPPGTQTRAFLSALPTIPGIDKAAPYRVYAAQQLIHFGSYETAQSLLRAVQRDPEYGVRYQAANSLLLIHGYEALDAGRLLKMIEPKLGPGARNASPEAIADLQNLIAERPIISIP